MVAFMGEERSTASSTSDGGMGVIPVGMEVEVCAPKWLTRRSEKRAVSESSSALAPVKRLLLCTIDRNLRTVSSSACSFGTTAGGRTFTSTSLTASKLGFFRMDMGVVVGTRVAARVAAETLCFNCSGYSE